MKSHFLVLCSVFVFSSQVFSLRAQDEETQPEPEPAFRLDLLVQRTLADEDGWASAPVRNKKAIGKEEYTWRYRIESREVPVYERVPKKVMVRTKSNSEEGESVMEEKTIYVRGKQKGTKTEERRIGDPEGPHSAKRTRTLYGPGGSDSWRLGGFGNNALAATMMLRQGEQEAQEAALGVALNLGLLYEEQGFPDLTWDLVWSLVLFAECGDEGLKKMVPAMVEKLMGAQIDEGPAMGLWGPVALDPKQLAYLWQKEIETSKAYSEAKAAAEASDTSSRLKTLNEAQLALQDAKTAMKAYTMGYRWARPDKTRVEFKDPDNPENNFSVALPPEYPFHTQTADMGSTWLALYGIRIARENNLIGRPQATTQILRGLRPPPPANPRNVIQLAGRAIVQQQHRSGAFPEANLHQPTQAFSGLQGLPGIPLSKTAQYPELPSPITLTSTAQGLSALAQIGHIVGPQGLRPYAQSMVAAKKVLDKQVDEVVEGNTQFIGETGLGSLGFLWMLGDLGPEMKVAPRDLGQLAAAYADDLEDKKKGVWKSDGRSVPFSTVWRAQAQVLPKRQKNHEDFHVPFVRVTLDPEDKDSVKRFWNSARSSSDSLYPEVTTAVALWILESAATGEEVLDVMP